MNHAALIQLQSWNRQQILSLFDPGHPCSLHIESALAKQTNGFLFVDSADNPQSAALNIGVCWYITGHPTDAFLRGVNELLPRDTYSVLVLAPSFTPAQRTILFHSLYFVRAKSRYAERTNSAPVMHPLAGEYRVLPIDRTFLEGDLEGACDLKNHVLHFWQSLDDYDRFGFGFAVIHDSKIVGHSLTDYVYGHRCEIGVSTDPQHRMRGLGAFVASTTANEAFNRGLTSVGWMSWANNAGSVAVSIKAGFVETHQYDVFINHWPAENPDNMSSEAFRAFARDYERQFVERPPSDSGYPHLVAATAWALAGEPEQCRKHIHSAIDIGWLTTLDQLRSLWPELFHNNHIGENAAWKSIFDRLADGNPPHAQRGSQASC